MLFLRSIYQLIYVDIVFFKTVFNAVSTEFGSTSPSMQTSHVLPSHTVTPTSVTQSVECAPTLALSDSAVQTTSRKLKAAVEEAKMESKRLAILSFFKFSFEDKGALGR